jgi:hypothetical protein
MGSRGWFRVSETLPAPLILGENPWLGAIPVFEPEKEIELWLAVIDDVEGVIELPFGDGLLCLTDPFEANNLTTEDPNELVGARLVTLARAKYLARLYDLDVVYVAESAVSPIEEHAVAHLVK